MTNRYICKYAEKCEEKQNRNSELFVYYNLHMKNQMLDNVIYCENERMKDDNRSDGSAYHIFYIWSTGQ